MKRLNEQVRGQIENVNIRLLMDLLMLFS